MCLSCKHGQFASCENVDLVGSFKKSVMKKKGKRIAKARHVADESDEVEQGDWVVTGVHGKRFTRGKLQYLLA